MKKIKLISAVTAFAAAASMMLAGCGTTADTNDTTKILPLRTLQPILLLRVMTPQLTVTSPSRRCLTAESSFSVLTLPSSPWAIPMKTMRS